MTKKRIKLYQSGFTVVELIVSFSLIMIIVVFLFQIIIDLKNIYETTSIKTELINKQSLISDSINKKINSKNINNITDCGNNCIEFHYTDNTSDLLEINYDEQSISFANYKTVLPSESYITNAQLDVAKTATFLPYSNNSILILNIGIMNDKLKNQNFEIKIFYQYNDNIFDLNAIEVND